MSALPTLGGNNGQASAINDHGLPVLWEKGKANALPTVGSDTEGTAWGINNRGQATGYSGTCTSSHAVRWEDDNVIPLDDPGVTGFSQGIGINLIYSLVPRRV